MGGRGGGRQEACLPMFLLYHSLGHLGPLGGDLGVRERRGEEKGGERGGGEERRREREGEVRRGEVGGGEGGGGREEIRTGGTEKRRSRKEEFCPLSNKYTHAF